MSSTASKACGYRFVSEPSDGFKCPLCSKVFEEPVQHRGCGRLFCKKCIVKDEPCPGCKQEKPRFHLDKISNRSIQSLRVKCTNMSEGASCDWEGPLAALEKHVEEGCEFVMVSCPNQCKDQEDGVLKVMKKSLSEHLKKDCPYRDFKCKICGETGIYASITTTTHLKDCLLKAVSTVAELQDQSFKLDAKLELKVSELDYHLKTFRIDLADKEEKNKGMLAELQEKLVLPNHEHVMQLHQLLDTLNTTFTFKITNCQRERETGSVFKSQPFYTRRGCSGYRFIVEVHLNSHRAFVSIFAYLVAGRSDSQLSWPFVGEISFTLLNQLENFHHHCEALSILTARNMRVGSPMLGFSDFISQDLCYKQADPGGNLQFLVDDTLYFKISVKELKPWLVCSNSN